jgi:hypothetical protein
VAAGGGCWACNTDTATNAQEIVLKIMRFLTGGLDSYVNWTEMAMKPAAGKTPDCAALMRQVQEQAKRRPEEEQA